MSSDTVISPPGQATVVGNDDCHHGDHALHLLAATHRNGEHIGISGRLAGQDQLTLMLALKDSESRGADRFTAVLDAVKSEASRTRELIQEQKNLDLRFQNLRFEVRANG